MTVYYAVFAIFYNASFAILEVSHLAMIPGITSVEKQRGSLSSIRTVGQVVSNMLIYSILWVMFKTGTKIYIEVSLFP